MLVLPDSPTAALPLADWLELQAILSPDGNSSRGDLESALRSLSAFEGNNNDAVEQKIMEVFNEVESRSRAADRAYPFTLDYGRNGVIELKSQWTDFPAYTFCLCLSYFGWDPHATRDINPPKLFEHVSCLAARQYLHGEAIGFGSPRKQLPSSFASAVEQLCQLIGEGEGYSQYPTLNRQDDTLDLVAWKDFADRLPGKLLMFGQCAAGKDWEKKLPELQPDVFVKLWMRRSPVSPIMRSFFVPHRADDQDWWRLYSAKGGIFFDRCRVAFWAHDAQDDLAQQVAWTSALLAQYIS